MRPAEGSGLGHAATRDAFSERERRPLSYIMMCWLLQLRADAFKWWNKNRGHAAWTLAKYSKHDQALPFAAAHHEPSNLKLSGLFTSMKPSRSL